MRKLLADLLGLEEAEDSLTMRDVDIWDSLKHMELIVSIEKKAGIELTFEEIVTMQSVGEIRRVLEARGIEWS
jgi:acyl carrier protein